MRFGRGSIHTLIDDLNWADTVVIGAGMYNFGMPAALKHWFDHVVQAGRTFHYVYGKPVGLVTGKKAVVIAASGGVYSSGDFAALDHFVPHVQLLLNFIGITDVSVVRAEGLALGNSKASQVMSSAVDQLAALA